MTKLASVLTTVVVLAAGTAGLVPAAAQPDAARMLAQATEYEWNEDAGRDPFVGNLDSAMPYLERLEAAVEESSGSGF